MDKKTSNNSNPMLKEANKRVKDAVDAAKSKWKHHLAIIVSKLNFIPKIAWRSIREISDGVNGHHIKPTRIAMKLSDGSKSKTDKQHMSVFHPHFKKLYNNNRPVYANAADFIAQREIMPSLANDFTWKEFLVVITDLKNDKSPGLNGVPPNAFKCMDDKNLKIVFKFICDFWDAKADYIEWHEGQVVIVPKNGDTSNPNKWRGINLMDVCSKIFGKMTSNRLYTLLKRHGTKYQFGSTPDVGCQDGSFSIKSLLHLRRQHNLPTFVAFVDLVKAYDTANHDLLLVILGKYGAPPKLVSAIRRMYTNLKVILKIGTETEKNVQTVGVRQGDPMSPVLFLF